MIEQSEIEKLKESVSLLALVEEELGPPAKICSDTHAWCCPFHDDSKPSFHVYPDTDTFYCFGCGANGDVLNWTQKRKKIGFAEAYNQLKTNARPTHRRPTQRVAAAKIEAKQAPNDKWQTQAQAFVERCQRELWGGYGKNALNELRNRRLSDETIRTAGLGWLGQGYTLKPEEWGLPTELNMSEKWIGPGIIIPWTIDGKLWLVNRRQQLTQQQQEQDLPKYVILPGSTKALYSIVPIEKTRPVALVEGEFDALTIHQEAGDLVTAVATGSATGARSSTWKEILKAMPLVLLCFDADDPGDKAREYWLKELPHARSWRPLFEDVNAMHQKEFPIRRWIETGLKSKR